MIRALADSTLQHSPIIAWLTLSVLVLFALVTLATLALISHHVLTQTERTRHRDARDEVAELIAPAAGDAQLLERAAAEAAQRVGLRATGAVLRELRHLVRGPLGDELTRQLEQIGEVARLLRQASSWRAWRRLSAAHRLGQCGGVRAAAALRQLLRDREPEVRSAARDAALLSGDQALIGDAVESFVADLHVRRSGRVGFYARLAAVAPGALAELVASGRLAAAEEKRALESLGHVRFAPATPLAEARLAHEDPELRVTVVRFLGRLEVAALRGKVAALLPDPVWFVRAAAARALEAIGVDGPAEASLAQALRDPAWWVRANAARALGRHGRLELLLDVAFGEDRYARDAAIGVLAGAPRLRELEPRLRALSAGHPEDEVLRSLLQRLEREAA